MLNRIWILTRWIGLLIFCSFSGWADEPRVLTLLDREGWKIILGGMVELDAISDSTRSFNEMIGNSPVVNGSSRFQFSLRNTRLSLAVGAPEVESWKTRGYFEADFLGFDPNPGSSGITNTEGSFFNNPTLRVRHAYFQANRGGFQLLAGQAWSLFGWQPYYFLGTAEVSPIPGMIYTRTAQVQALQNLSEEEWGTFQAAIAFARPPQRDSGYPDFQAGLRFASDIRKSGFTGGASGLQRTQPMSLAVSGLARPILVSGSQVWASACAVDTLLPIVASSNGKDFGNTLSFTAEYSFGSGYGDQFPGWTGNTANPLSASTVSPSKNLSLDGGIGDYDVSGNFQLINLKTVNAQLQYHFPTEWRSFLTLGGGYLYSNNMENLVSSGGLASSGRIPYSREYVGFANFFHDFTDQIRTGFEFAHIETGYADGSIGLNNRYQLTLLFVF